MGNVRVRDGEHRGRVGRVVERRCDARPVYYGGLRPVELVVEFPDGERGTFLSDEVEAAS